MELPKFFENRAIYSRVINIAGRPEFHWWLDTKELIDRCIIAGVWENASTLACARWVKPGMRCLDLGANVGYYTVLLAYLAGEEGCVIGFEPMEDACTVAKLHVRMNCPDNAEVQHVCISDVDSTIDANFNYSWHPDHKERIRGLVPQRRLDTLVGDVRIDFMKIDVDGYEFKILLGATELLKRCKPKMLLEVCDYTLRDAEGRGQDTSYETNTLARTMLEHLEGLGYKLLREENDTEASIEELLAIRDLSKSSINILCV